MRRRRGVLRGAWFVVGLVTPWAAWAAGGDELALKLPEGFRVEVVADESLANDTYAMTLDAKGRVVVTTRGEVKTLHDENGDGRADRATRYAETATGGMGLCFDGNDLMFCGDGWLSRYTDADGDGRADGPPRHLLPLAFAEHGGHAMRKGPDGWWYVIGGNDSGIGPGHATLPTSPVRRPEAGAVLRLPPDLKGSEILAHGFRNPYDFDFNPAGELFTYDSDVERDIFLPWYVPTRLYHVAPGGHHGWRLTGFQRSWPRPGDDPGTVDVLEPVGRGSPTGVVCYRHTQFPARFRGGLFVLDWTFGKVYFVALKPEGASYKASLEVFLEPVGTSGFAPTDAEVAPDGSLLISIGGRKTRGSVYRVSYVGPREDMAPKPATELDEVLRAPQPLDAWSRARWVPLAKKLGRDAFLKALEDRSRTDAEHVRAVEVLTELFGGLDRPRARLVERRGSEAVRRRAAWSLGRAPLEAGEVTMADLTGDLDPGVRVAALDAWQPASWKKVRTEWQVALLVLGLGHADKRVRQSSARLAAASPQATRDVLANVIVKAHPQMRLSAMLAELWLRPDRPVHEDLAVRLCELLAETRDSSLRLQAVRLLQRALGDYHLKDPAVEVETGYSLQPSLKGHEALVAGVLTAVRPLFPAPTGPGRFGPPQGPAPGPGPRPGPAPAPGQGPGGFFDPKVSARLDEESARLLAMLEDDDPETPRKVANFWTATSSPTRDLHFLIVFARLRGPRDASLSERVARAVVALDGKLKGQEQRTKQSWNARVVELVGLLQGRDPLLADALLRQPGFVAPNHVALALGLPAGAREVAARRFLAAAKDDPEFVWSGPLIELLSALPPAEVRPIFRAKWSNLALRDALLPALASPPDEADRPAYLDGLGSSQPEAARAALAALEALPRDPSPEHLPPLIRLVRRLAKEPRERELTRRVVALLERQAGTHFDATTSADGSGAARRVDEAVIAWFRGAHPDLASRLDEGGADLAAWARRLKGVDWSQGDPARGAKLFQERGCQTCHDGPRALGPDLAGVTNRLARHDLFAAILAPNLDVSPLYRTTLVETRQGLVYSGTVAFESADGLILQTGATTTVRVANDDIVSRQPGTISLMPERLLEGCTDRDLADLDSYLRSLSGRRGR